MAASESTPVAKEEAVTTGQATEPADVLEKTPNRVGERKMSLVDPNASGWTLMPSTT